MADQRRPQVTIRIPADELTITASRSSGHGGQNVNKRSTRVTVSWNVASTGLLSDDQKQLVRQALGHRMVGDELRVTASDERTQSANRRLAIERLHTLVNDSLNPPPAAIPGYVPPFVAAARRRNAARLREERRRRQEKYQARQRSRSPEDW